MAEWHRTMDFCVAHRAEYLGGAGCEVRVATEEWGGIPTPCEVERGKWTAVGGPVKGNVVDHPDRTDLWRHEPPLWKPCYVCGELTCWVETDVGFKHPECDMYPNEEGDVRVVLGVKTVEGNG